MRTVAAVFLSIIFSAGISLAQVDLLNARVEKLEIKNSDDSILVSYRVSGTFTKDIFDKIQSGIETVFKHEIKIYKKIPFLPVKNSFLEKVIVTSVKYDTLTKQYSLMKKVDGQVTDTSITEKPEDVEKWMTEIRDFSIGGVNKLRGKKNYFLKVRTSLAPNFLLFFIPYDYSASKEKELKF